MTHGMCLALTIAVCVLAGFLCFTMMVLWFLLGTMMEYFDRKRTYVYTCNEIAEQVLSVAVYSKDGMKHRLYALFDNFLLGRKVVQK